MLHKMSLHEGGFEKIKKGLKTIETRLYDDKRRAVRLGDTIIFERLPERKEALRVEVVGLSRFSNFRDLFDSIDGRRFGYSDEYTAEEKVERLRRYYCEEEERKYGVLAIHVRVMVNPSRD